jgi:hypothetical protein
MPVVDINGNAVEFPDTLSPDALNKAVASAAQQMGAASQPQPQKGVIGFLERNSDQLPPDAGFLNRKTKYLTVPENLLRQGLTKVAARVPNPKPQGKPGRIEQVVKTLVPELATTQPGVIQDVARGAPRIMAEGYRDVAPDFVSRGSILTAGAAKVAGAAAPLTKAVLRGAGAQGESLSGIAPKAEGALEAAYKDPMTMFSKGRKSVSPLYEAAKAEMAPGANIFKGMYKPEQIFDAAKEYIDKGGKLEPAEALMARKAAGKLMSSGRYIKDEIVGYQDTFDQMAKASSNIAKADPQYKKAIYGEALRKLAPQNKGGGTSAFKLGIMTALENMGLPGKVVLAAMSPAAQGVAATGAGLAGRYVAGPLSNPATAVAALQAALQYRKQRNGGAVR